jgi:hypothetical protein
MFGSGTGIISRTGFHTVLQGKNGAGDPWYTDGRLGVAVLLMGRITSVEAEIVNLAFSSSVAPKPGLWSRMAPKNDMQSR